VYCPHCREIYFPRSSRLECLDGAYFGTSFAHLFFLTYQHLVPQSMPTPYVPRLYGFKIHKSVKDTLRKQREQSQKPLTSVWQPAGPVQGAVGPSSSAVPVMDAPVETVDASMGGPPRRDEILAD